MTQNILREAVLYGGAYDGEIVNLDLSLCQKDGEYFVKKDTTVYIVYIFGGWLNKKRARFRFKGYDHVGRNDSSCSTKVS